MKAGVPKRIKDTLSKKNPPYYVLITCEEPSEDGQMQVEMSYEGDVSLVSYLLNEAQIFMDDLDNQQAIVDTPIPNLRLMK